MNLSDSMKTVCAPTVGECGAQCISTCLLVLDQTNVVTQNSLQTSVPLIAVIAVIAVMAVMAAMAAMAATPTMAATLESIEASDASDASEGHVRPAGLPASKAVECGCSGHLHVHAHFNRMCINTQTQYRPLSP